MHQVKEAARSALLEYASSKGGSKITPEVFEEICGGAAVGPAALKQLKSELEDAGVLLHDEKGVYICSPTVAKAVAEAVEEASKAGQEGKVRGRSPVQASRGRVPSLFFTRSPVLTTSLPSHRRASRRM